MMIDLCQQPLTRLYQYVKPHWGSLRVAISYSFINKLLDLAPPVLMAWAVDSVSGQPPWLVRSIAGEDPWMIGGILGLLAVVIFGAESLFQWLFSVAFMTVAQKVQHELRTDAYSHMQTREMAFFENHRVGETMSMLSDDVNQLERFLNTVFNDIVQLVALFIISAVILLSASPGLSLIAILPIPLIVWGSLSFQKLLAPKYKRVREAVGRVNTRLENNLGGIAVIKAFTAESFETSRLKDVSRAYRDRNIEAVRLSALFTPLIRMGVSLGFGGVLLVGAVWTMRGDLTPGEFTLFGMMSQRILWPLTRLGTILDETERCRASAARIFGLLDTPSTILDPELQQSGTEVGAKRFTGALQFCDVHFRYERGQEIVKGLNLEIGAGETVGIAGATGAGKSTLVKLVLRLYDPTSGTVCLDGTSLTQLPLKQIRRNVALVSQDVYIFQGTIGENIAYGLENPTSAQVVEAARQAQLHEFVTSLPEGYETVVGERGIKLSGGQRQRLSIARALLRDAPVMILDEATSSVDTETERQIQKHLAHFTKGRTALIIAHRLSTIRGADRILVLKNGQVVEEGGHDQLLKLRGVYADLWHVQSGEASRLL